MPQKQNTVVVDYADGTKSKAAATGNNAAWKCACGITQILLGRSGTLKSASKQTLVECPICQRQYRVVPEDKDRGRVLRVDEVTPAADATYKPGTLAFFPWLQLNENVAFGEFELVPYKRGLGPGKDPIDQRTMDRVLMPYYSASYPISMATLLRTSGQEWFTDFDDEARTEAFVFSEVLALGGLAARKFFGSLGYQNREHFRLYIQRSSGSGGAALTSRRRDGSTTNYWTNDTYRVQKPEHISGSWPNAIDVNLVSALLSARQSQEWERFYEAILGFNLANTDSGDVSEGAEAVLTIGAMERLLGCKGGNENDLASRFANTFVPSESVPVDKCTPEIRAALDAKFQNKASTLREQWIRDFFRLRGTVGHGKAAEKYPSVWSLRTHLLLAAFVFPLLVKIELAGLNLYKLTEKDHEGIDAFESLVCYKHFNSSSSNADDFPWNKVIADISWRNVLKRIVESLASDSSPT